MANIGHCKVDHLIVDSGAFIRNIEIKDIGEKIYSLREVVSEIRDKATRQRLQVLPYDITFKEPTPEAYHAVVEFSKKTGDFVSLSAVDLRVLALAYQLEKENVGAEHIRLEPVRKVAVWQTKRNFENPAQIAGFYLGPKETSQKSSKSETASVTSCERGGQHKGEIGEDSKSTAVGDRMSEVERSNEEDEFDKVKQGVDENEEKDAVENKEAKNEGETEGKVHEVKENEGNTKNKDDENEGNTKNKDDENEGNTKNKEDENEGIDGNQDDGRDKTEDCDKEKTQNDGQVESHDGSHGNIEDDCDDDEEEDDDDGCWVTPDNIAAVLMESNLLDVKPVQVVPVACLTTDFAMQNVLLQMGLNVLSTNGMLIKRAKSYVLRCSGCFKVVTDMARVVCPKCGYNTLRKVSMTVNDDGSVQYYLSNRKPTKTRALQHPRPTPKEGKHANQQHKQSQAKYNVFNLDNLTLDSPFAINDFNRRSAANRLKGQNRNRRK